MITTLENDPEHGSEKCIIFIQDDKNGGIVLHGYDDDSEAMVDLILHLKAIFKANGKDMILMPLNEG